MIYSFKIHSRRSHEPRETLMNLTQSVPDASDQTDMKTAK